MSTIPVFGSSFTYSPQSGGKRLEVYFNSVIGVYNRIVEVEGSTVDDRIIEDTSGTDRIVEVAYG